MSRADVIQQEVNQIPTWDEVLAEQARLVLGEMPVDHMEKHDRLWRAFYLGRRYAQLRREGE